MYAIRSYYAHCKVIHATDTSLWLEWEDKQREYEQIYYDIWLNNTLVDSTSSLQYTLGNLDPSKNYCVTVKARNHIGQISDGVKVEASTLDVITSGNLALHKPVKASSIENSDRITSYNVCYTKLLRIIAGIAGMYIP